VKRHDRSHRDAIALIRSMGGKSINLTQGGIHAASSSPTKAARNTGYWSVEAPGFHPVSRLETDRS
jgi:hypothetical protein